MLDLKELQQRREARHRQRMWRRRRRRALGLLAVAALAGGVVAGADAGRRPAPAVHRAASGAQRRPARHHHHHHHHRRSPLPPRTGLVQTRPRAAAVPILMYHVIAPAPIGAPFPALYVTPKEFAAQMRALYDAGWTAVTMDQVWDAWARGTPLPAGRPVVISFDNGYHSQFVAALPILRRLHWVGVENLQLTGLPRSQGGLSAAALRRMLAAGWELDTQGYSHADLVAIDPAQLHREVAGARRTLRRRWHEPVHWFCFPSGHYDARVLAAVRAAGYRGATTVVPGWARRTDDPYRLPRLRVVAGTTPAGLLAQIARERHHAAAPAAYGAA